MTASTALLVVLLCLHSSKPASSSIFPDYYKKPVCEDVDGFYCPNSANLTNAHTCPPRTERCTDDAESICSPKSYDHCNYDAQSGKFMVYRIATLLSILPVGRRSASRGIFDCLQYELTKHHFITYRGLMYEYGIYDNGNARVQDPLDPNYEYKLGRRSIADTKYIGLSSCTYDEVQSYVRIWNSKKYKLCSNNCQDFARGLGRYLTGDCLSTGGKRDSEVSDDELAAYIYSIAGENCNADGNSRSQHVAPQALVAICTAVVAVVFAMINF